MSLLGGSKSSATDQSTAGTDEAVVLGANAKVESNDGFKFGNVTGGVVIGDGGQSLALLGEKFTEALEVVSGNFSTAARTTGDAAAAQSALIASVLDKMSGLSETKITDGGNLALNANTKTLLVVGILALVALLWPRKSS